MTDHYNIVFAEAIQIRYQTTDSSVVPIVTHPISFPGHTPGGPGLTTVAKAGIGLGVAVGIFALIGVAFVCGRRYRSAARLRREDTIPLQSTEEPPRYDDVVAGSGSGSKQ